jgi:hypothetical protein
MDNSEENSKKIVPLTMLHHFQCQSLQLKLLAWDTITRWFGQQIQNYLHAAITRIANWAYQTLDMRQNIVNLFLSQFAKSYRVKPSYKSVEAHTIL